MRRRLCCPLWLIAALWLLFPVSVAAITLGQVDDFESGLPTQMWAGGSILINQPDGGPTGVGDGYLQISTGGSPGQLGAFNETQWAGNFAAALVGGVRLHLKNFGPDSVSIRLMITTPGCSSPPLTCTAWVSTIAQVLPPDPDPDHWALVDFSLAEADLTRVFGADTYANSMTNVAKLHLRHDDGTPPTPPGTQVPVDAMIGMDNVTTLPEPSKTGGVLAGSLFLIALSPRENRRRRGNKFPS